MSELPLENPATANSHYLITDVLNHRQRTRFLEDHLFAPRKLRALLLQEALLFSARSDALIDPYGQHQHHH